MSAITIQQALINRLVTMSSPPNIVVPEDPETKDLPRFVVFEAGAGKVTTSIGGRVRTRAEILVRVETARNNLTTGTGGSNDLVAALEARFQPGDNFGGVTVIDAPDVRPALPDEQAYVVPVYISGVMEA